MAVTLEERLKNIEANTLAELDAGIGTLLEKKENQALTAGIAVGTITAAMLGKRFPILALGAGLLSSVLTTRFVFAQLVK